MMDIRTRDISNRTVRVALLLIATLVVLSSALPARAAWPNDPTMNVKVPMGYEGGRTQVWFAAPDSGGGMLMFAAGLESWFNAPYVQRVDALGQPRWSTPSLLGGLQLGVPAYFSQPAPDGSGGAFVAMSATNVIALAHVGAGGTQWPMSSSIGGVAIATPSASDGWYWPRVAADGQGGAIEVWSDSRAPLGLWAQRVDAAGAPLWTSGGVPLQSSSLADRPWWFQAVSDGAGGVVAVKGTPLTAFSLRADGTRRTPATGRPLCTTPGTQGREAGLPHRLDSAIPDGAGGMIVVWVDTRSDASGDLYAQRVDSLGFGVWTANGVPVCTAVGAQSQVVVTSDGAGGAIVAWSDARAGATVSDLYAQRIADDGTPRWASDGVAVCVAAGAQTGPAVVTRASGGAIVAWTDLRSGAYGDIYAQSLDADGIAQWTPDGAAVCVAGVDPPTLVGDQYGVVLVATGGDGAIAAWNDHRDHCASCMGDTPYAQYVPLDQGALLGVEPPHSLAPLARLRVTPNPARAAARVALARDASARASLELLDVAGRVVRARDLSALAPGAREVTLEDLGALPAGLYLVRVKQGEALDTARLAVTR